MPIFLLTDIERSTEKWEKHRDKMGEVLIRHDQILKQTIEKFKGDIVKHTGDGVFAVFCQGAPLHCAIELQKRFENEKWNEVGEIRIRIGIHAGDAEKRGNDYFGATVNRTARIMEAAWGGQIVLTPEVITACTTPPGATLQDLGIHMLPDLGEPQQIYGLVHPDLALTEFPALRSLSAHPHNLPAQPTPFVGRIRELEELAKLIDNPKCRLINVVGPGGIGKTRLAIQAAADKINKFRHGVYLIPLDALTIGSIQFLVFTIANALKFSFYSREDPKLQLINYLREKEMLMVMDNFEHLIAEAELLTEIFENCPHIKFLVTSRERLRLRGEWIIEIKGMDFPDRAHADKFDEYSAIQLFMQSAQRVKPDFVLAQNDEAAIVQICDAVSGIPLGIELAASWVRSLSCSEIAQEIGKGLDFLTTTLQDVPKRHQSLRGVFDYSWNLLTRKEKNTFRGLAVFPDGFQRDAAQSILAASLSELTVLADKSLIRRKPNGRYELLQILRQFAQEQLEKNPAIRDTVHDAHCAYYANVLDRYEEKFKESDPPEFYTMMSGEIENIRAAWQWGVEHCHIEDLAELLKGMFRFYERRGWLHEAEQIFRITAEMMRIKFTAPFEHDTHKAFYSATIARWGGICRRLSLYEQGRDLLEESLSYARELNNTKAMAFAYNELGVIAYRFGEFINAKQLHKQALKIREEIGNQRLITASLNNLAVVVYALGDYNEAKRLHEQALSIRQRINDTYGIATSLNNLGNVMHSLGNSAKASSLYEQSLVLRRTLNDRLGIGSCLNNLGLCAENLGDLERARQLYEESVALKMEIGDTRAAANTLDNLGRISEKSGDDAGARRYYRESLTMLRTIKAMPTTLAVVATIGKFFLGIHKYDLALICAVLVQHHPAAISESRETASAILAELVHKLPAQTIDHVRNETETQRAENVLEMIIAAL
ncbi:tetratricopeptide repeat protein [candidate division WOR-3 bacterium]|nr:tetratricopeptide repeat protein [candidate division WOR-3 bacterium]